MDKPATTDHDVHRYARERWSPRAFDQREVPTETLRSLLEAARWAPSAYNEQPWRFFVARKQEPEAFAAAVELLVEFNQAWARHAPVLLFTVAKRSFSHDGSPNVHAWHDIGQAAAWLTVEASYRGLAVHQIGGIRADALREAYGIPDEYEPVTAIAIGYPGEPEQLQGGFAEEERAPRVRKPQGETVFAGSWDQAWEG